MLTSNFDVVLLLNGHMGNGALIDSVVKSVSSSRDDDVEILGIAYFALAEPFIEEIRDSEPGGMGHGGEFETSLMLHLHPELVRENEIQGTNRETTYSHERKDLTSGGRSPSIVRSISTPKPVLWVIPQ